MPDEAMGETAYAKINLALHVRARRADHYHSLETLFAFAEDGDRLTATLADTLSLEISGPFAAVLVDEDPANNLVLRSAAALRAAFGVTAGAALHLDKRLPVASGIGGGSADSAAALRLLARLWNVPLADARVSRIASELGADVPACLASVAVRGEGRGDILVPVAAGALAGTPLLLVNPGVGLSTAAVFAGWDGHDHGSMREGDLWEVAREGRNDLEPAARTLVPAIEDVLTRLGMLPDVKLARMSGSGATCFALFETVEARDAAASAIGVERPEWWLLSSRLR
jgi:4-diphosphocytidyl-2-C-methyl-D-erythritol kinase